MKILAALLSVLFLNLAASSNVKESCNPAECVAPDCRCFSQSPPDGLHPEDIPQLVFLTFDEAITKTNMVNYSSILHNRKNPNDCPVTMTFFVTHDSNDYTFTHQLFYTGNEIASASISHSTPAQTWASKTVEEWTDELGGMRQTLAKFANIPIASIQGERAPFLQTSGDVTFQAMQKSGLKWDCSYPTIKYSEPAAFPYTMDYGFAQDCQIEPCPTSTYPGVWNVPMIVLRDVEGHTCSMADGCANRTTTSEEAYTFLKSNFNSHYNSTKAPFGVHLHAAWFLEKSSNLDGYLQFLDDLATMKDVYIVTVSQGLEWMKNPVPLTKANEFFSCPKIAPSKCTTRNCYFEDPIHGNEIVMTSCVPCPDVNPTPGNPFGEL